MAKWPECLLCVTSERGDASSSSANGQRNGWKPRHNSRHTNGNIWVMPRANALVISGSCQEPTPSTERGKQMRRKRFQKGSQDRKHGRHRVWVACWWEDGSRRSKVLGRCSQLGKGEAEAILSVILQPINSGVTQLAKPIYTFERFTKEVYLPFCRRVGRSQPPARRSRS